MAGQENSEVESGKLNDAQLDAAVGGASDSIVTDTDSIIVCRKNARPIIVCAKEPQSE